MNKNKINSDPDSKNGYGHYYIIDYEINDNEYCDNNKKKQKKKTPHIDKYFEEDDKKRYITWLYNKITTFGKNYLTR